MDYDVTIIGGGPAGLAAALTLGRSMRSTLVLDSGAPRNAPAEAMHNVLGRDGTPPARLREDGRRELASYPTVSVRPEAVVSVAPGFEVTLASGETVGARRLLLATGVVDELLPIPGLADRWGRTVLHCPYCHGYEQRGKRLAVLGATPHHVFIATLLRRYFEDVVLLANGDEPPADVLDLPVFAEPVAALSGDADIAFADGSRLERDAIFAGGRAPQRSTFADDLGCALLGDRLRRGRRVRPHVGHRGVRGGRHGAPRLAARPDGGGLHRHRVGRRRGRRARPGAPRRRHRPSVAVGRAGARALN